MKAQQQGKMNFSLFYPLSRSQLDLSKEPLAPIAFKKSLRQ